MYFFGGSKIFQRLLIMRGSAERVLCCIKEEGHMVPFIFKTHPSEEMVT